MTILKTIYRFASSMKAGLIILSLIGLFSALGSSLMPDVFSQTLIFRFLIVLLFINMALCTALQVKRFVSRRRKAEGKNRVRFRQPGVLLLHVGVVLILVGGAINSYFGQKAEMRIIEGEIGSVASVIETRQPFSLKVEKFEITFNADGSPSQYYSHVRVVEGNKESGNYSISVNHPLKRQGIKVYQESFGYLIKAEGVYGSEKTVNKTLKEGDFLKIPGIKRTVKAYKYIPNFDPQYGMNSKTLRPDNPRIVFSVYENGKLLGVGAARFGEPVEIDKDVICKFNGVLPYTIFRVKSDPGLPVAAAGGIALMVGVCLALLLSPTDKRNKQKAEEAGVDDDALV